MSRCFVGILLLQMAVLLVGCGDSNSRPPPSPDDAAKTPSHPPPTGSKAAQEEGLPK